MIRKTTKSRLKRLTQLAVAILLCCVETQATENVLIIGHTSLAKLDLAEVRKIYTGKTVEIGGIPLTVVNASSGSTVRNRFLQTYLNQDEDKYTGYWTVRRYIGKGAPPAELPSATEMIRFVQATPGAVGYIDENELKPGINVLLRK